MQRERETGCGVAAAAANAGARSERAGIEVEMKNEVCTAEGWVRKAVGVLKREGAEGEYWRDGRDLEGLWGRVGGGYV